MAAPLSFCLGDLTLTKDEYYYGLVLVPTKISLVVLVTEATINLAYYKDIVFALVQMSNFGGMLYSSY